MSASTSISANSQEGDLDALSQQETKLIAEKAELKNRLVMLRGQLVIAKAEALILDALELADRCVDSVRSVQTEEKILLARKAVLDDEEDRVNHELAALLEIIENEKTSGEVDEDFWYYLQAALQLIRKRQADLKFMRGQL